MSHSTPSALVTDQGRRIQFRIRSRFYEITQEELRTLLDMPPGTPGLGITIDHDRLLFEFADSHSKELSEGQLHERLTEMRKTSGTSTGV
jgi:hypothetical protein